MSAKDDADEREKPISALGLENLADVLAALANRYRQAARLMREAGIDEIRIAGTPTAIRGIGYLQRHTKNAGSAALTEDALLKEMAPEISSDLIKAMGAAVTDSVAKQLSSKRKKP